MALATPEVAGAQRRLIHKAVKYNDSYGTERGYFTILGILRA